MAALLVIATGLLQLSGINPASASNSTVGQLSPPSGAFTNSACKASSPPAACAPEPPTGPQPYNSSHWGVVMGDTITQTITGVGTDDPASSGGTTAWSSYSPIPMRLSCGSGCTGSNTSAPGVISAPSGQYQVATAKWSSANGGTITFTYTVPATGQFCTTYPIMFGANYQDKSSTSPDGDATWTNTDAPFNTSTSTNGCPVDVANARTATTTNIDGTTVTQGTAVYPVVTSIDDANSQPSSKPTGTVTYTLYGDGTCTGTAVSHSGFTNPQTVTISGGVVPNGTSVSWLTPGTYSYLTSYSGDSNYGSSTTGCEVFTIAAAVSQTVTTQVETGSGANVTSNVALGTATLDTTSLSSSSPTPTGTVTYGFYDNGTCNGTATSTQTVTLSGGSVPNASTQTLGAGSYSYEASYSGDSNYGAATGSCEEFGVSPATPTISNPITNSSNTNITGSSVPLGTTFQDTSSLGGTVSGFTPTGTATYTYYANGTCSGGGTAAPAVSLSSGAIPNNGSITPGAGSYSYTVTYSGDSNYHGVTSGCSSVTVNTGTLSISTQVQNGSGTNITGGSAALGTATHDTVSLTGVSGETPSGSVTYSFFDNGTCSGSPTGTPQTVTLSGGTATGSTAQTLAGGTYSYLTSYSGDSNYASAVAGCEAFTISPASLTLTTQVENNLGNNVTGGDVILGTPTHDTATLSAPVGGFTPTGSVTYDFFDNGTCNGSYATTETDPLSGGVVPASTGQTLGAGSYSYLTSYSGDSNYSPVTAGCEPFTVGATNLTLITQVQNGSGGSVASAPLGTPTDDTASLSGPVVGFPPTGSVTYDFFDNGTCSGSYASTQAVSVSSGFVGNASYQTLGAGSYSYLASYSGDANYNPTAATCEPFTVNQASLSLSTDVQDGNGNNYVATDPLGSSTNDTASFGSTVAPFQPTGSVTYDFFDNGTCNGSPTGTPQVVSVTSGLIGPASFQTLGGGSYSYLASYSGDSNYNPVSALCESFTINPAMPSVSTAVLDQNQNNVTGLTIMPGSTVNDTASIGSTVAPWQPTGTVTYEFFDNGTCNGSYASTQTVTVSGGAVPAASVQSSLAGGNYSYLTSYSGDSNYAPSTASCESFTRGYFTPTLSSAVMDAHGNNVTGPHVYVPLLSVNDTSTIGGAQGGFPITGTVTYTLYVGGTCSGTVFSTQTVTIVNGTVPPASSVILPLIYGSITQQDFSYQTTYNGDANYGVANGPCELVTRWCSDAYWRTYPSVAGGIILGAQPFYVGDEKISGTQGGIANKIQAVFAVKDCVSATSQAYVSCLADHVLVEEIDLLNGSPTNIQSTIATAQAFLGLGGTAQTVTYEGTTSTGIVYTGPSAVYTLTANQATIANNLSATLLNYEQTGQL